MSWLSYQLNWVRQRHDFLVVHDALHNGHPKFAGMRYTFDSVPAPGQLWILGEEGVRYVVITIPISDFGSLVLGNELKREAERLFPESEICFQPGW